MKRLTPRSSLAIVALLSGCARIGPPLPPELELPKPVNDLRAVRKGSRVTLSWTIPTRTTAAETVRHMGPTRVCRNAQAALPMKQCSDIVGVVSPHATKPETGAAKAEYTDTLPSNAAYTGQVAYAVEVLNTYGRSAGLSNHVLVPSGPAMPPPTGFHLGLSAAGVQIFWNCPPEPSPQPADVQFRLRVHRRESGAAAAPTTSSSKTKTSQVVAAEADAFGCQKPVFDRSFQWEKTYLYRADIVTIVPTPGQPETQIEGDDTPPVELAAHDTFPPATPAGLEAAFSGPGQSPAIDLSWNPDTEADLAGYYVYRREEGGPPLKLNSEPARTSAYRDRAIQSGKKYFYSVSAVDVRGNESGRSEEASESVP